MPTLRKTSGHRTTKRRVSNKGKTWTKSQVQSLRKIAKKLPTRQIAKQLGRSVDAVRSKAHAIGCSLSKTITRKLGKGRTRK